jgi:histo-blood group ABO system transferase
VGSVSVACLVMATGKYARYIPALIDSFELYFLQPDRREFAAGGHSSSCVKYSLNWYVFTDNRGLINTYGPHPDPTAPVAVSAAQPAVRKITLAPNTRLRVVEQRRLGWPYDSLQRFDSYLRAYNGSEGWGMSDFVYAFDADLFAIADIPVREVLSDLVGATHPGFPPGQRSTYTYEQRQPDSTAFVNADEGEFYFAGGWVGGRSPIVHRMFTTLHKNIQLDLQRNIMAEWHDESHVNRYFINHRPTLRLPHGMLAGEHWESNGQPSIPGAKLMNINKNHTDMRFGCSHPQAICNNN